MEPANEIVSADGAFRIEFFRRADGTYGYAESRRVEEAAGSGWRRDSLRASVFDSLDTAHDEASGRVPWLRREREWPARDRDPCQAETCVANWIQCPFCRVRFSLLDPDRWGGGRHLTCGQRIEVAS